MDGQFHLAGARREPPFVITSIVPETDSGTIVSPASSASEKAARLEAVDPAVGASRAFRKNNQRDAVGHETPPPIQDAGAIGIAAIDQQMPGPPQMPAEKRETVRATPSR